MDQEEDGDLLCGDLSADFYHRRHVDLALSSAGVVLGLLHLTLLLFIRYGQKHKGFFLMLIQALISLLTLSFLAFGCVIDLCAIPLSSALAFFRAYIWVFAVNALIACYGFIVLALCLDRYVALNSPLYYKLVFSKLKARLVITGICSVVAVVVCFKWLLYNKVEGGEGFVENEVITSTLWYVTIKTISTLIQYFISGTVMILLSWSISHKLKELDRIHVAELRMTEGSRMEWSKNHKTTANICNFLTISYILFNWPYAITDYFYTDELSETQWYGAMEVITNTSQLVYLQLNVFFFAYCSRIYRQNLCCVSSLFAGHAKRLLFWQRRQTPTRKQDHNGQKLSEQL